MEFLLSFYDVSGKPAVVTSRNVSCFLRLSWSSTSGNATREARINDAKVRWLLITV